MQHFILFVASIYNWYTNIVAWSTEYCLQYCKEHEIYVHKITNSIFWYFEQLDDVISKWTSNKPYCQAWNYTVSRVNTNSVPWIVLLWLPGDLLFQKKITNTNNGEHSRFRNFTRWLGVHQLPKSLTWQCWCYKKTQVSDFRKSLNCFFVNYIILSVQTDQLSGENSTMN